MRSQPAKRHTPNLNPLPQDWPPIAPPPASVDNRAIAPVQIARACPGLVLSSPCQKSRSLPIAGENACSTMAGQRSTNLVEQAFGLHRLLTRAVRMGSRRRARLIRLHVDFVFVLTGLSQIVGRLHSNPNVGRCSERLGKADGHVGDTPAWPLTRRERVVRMTPSAMAPFRNGQAKRLQAIEPHGQAGMRRRILHGHWRLLLHL